MKYKFHLFYRVLEKNVRLFSSFRKMEAKLYLNRGIKAKCYINVLRPFSNGHHIPTVKALTLLFSFKLLETETLKLLTQWP